MKKKKQVLPNVSMTFDIEEFPNCCGIGVMLGLEWWGNDDDPNGNVPDFWAGSSINLDAIPQECFNSTLKTATDRCRRSGYKMYMCSITDADKVSFKKIDIAMKKNGWKELSTTKSNHGKYLIHVYERKFARKRKRAKS